MFAPVSIDVVRDAYHIAANYLKGPDDCLATWIFTSRCWIQSWTISGQARRTD
jgi:hypothetical protein